MTGKDDKGPRRKRAGKLRERIAQLGAPGGRGPAKSPREATDEAAAEEWAKAHPRKGKPPAK